MEAFRVAGINHEQKQELIQEIFDGYAAKGKLESYVGYVPKRKNKKVAKQMELISRYDLDILSGREKIILIDDNENEYLDEDESELILVVQPVDKEGNRTTKGRDSDWISRGILAVIVLVVIIKLIT